ncbi:MAG TPA: amino acid ABC transporter substrate-binding protein [Actinomycetota bacterium]|nr:amino acid ABC transporter substrate-binding protein [Actinomycetota bacterium]
MRRRMSSVVVLAAVLGLVAAACTREQPQGQGGGGGGGGGAEQQQASVVQEIQDRGILRCGVNETVPGFGFETAEGQIEGFDIDFCIAFAAAVFGEPSPQLGTHYELIPVDAEQRLAELQAGTYDVLVRNTTWTSSRDGAERINFAHVNFYDAQGMMVREGEFASIDEMDGARICVTAGTTTELNLADYFQAQGLDFTPVVLEDNDQILQAFTAGRCDGWTSDLSQLAGLRAQFEQETGPLTIFEDVMSKEPLAPAVLDGDQEWFDVVNWVTNGIILAEELGVTSENVEQQVNNPDNPQIAALLGVPFEAETETISVDHGLAVENDFMQHVLAAVGNYGEIFDRHIGPDTDLGLERGLNALWIDGGIQYGMPFR